MRKDLKRNATELDPCRRCPTSPGTSCPGPPGPRRLPRELEKAAPMPWMFPVAEQGLLTESGIERDQRQRRTRPRAGQTMASNSLLVIWFCRVTPALERLQVRPARPGVQADPDEDSRLYRGEDSERVRAVNERPAAPSRGPSPTRSARSRRRRAGARPRRVVAGSVPPRWACCSVSRRRRGKSRSEGSALNRAATVDRQAQGLPHVSGSRRRVFVLPEDCGEHGSLQSSGFE